MMKMVMVMMMMVMVMVITMMRYYTSHQVMKILLLRMMLTMIL